MVYCGSTSCIVCQEGQDENQFYIPGGNSSIAITASITVIAVTATYYTINCQV